VLLHRRPDLDHLTHELMAQHVTGAHGRDVAAQQVQI
jgi:hypothetical protein